jgi:hypothetical protein
MTHTQLSNNTLQITFAAPGAGAEVQTRIALRIGDHWQAAHEGTQAQRWLALRAERADPPVVHPAWLQQHDQSNLPQFFTERVQGDADLFATGERQTLVLTQCEQVDPQTVRCRTSDAALVVEWHLPANGFAVEIRYTYLPPTDGYYAVVFFGFAGLAPEAVQALLAGPLFSERRLPPGPGVLIESLLPLPAVLIETRLEQQPLTWAIAADMVGSLREWRTDAESRYALAVCNEQGAIQPLFVAPVPGCSGSRLAGGVPFSATFLLQARFADWWASYSGLLRDTYGLRSYRENAYGSFTDAFHAMIALLKDERFGGWRAEGRGLANIEHPDGIKLASPSAAISAALITGDQALLYERALPIIEYALSRSHYGFTWRPNSETGGYDDVVRQAFSDLGGPAWDAPVLVALHTISRGYTPALAELARQQAAGIHDFYIRREDFQVSLSLHRLTGEAQYLEQARQQADEYIARRVATLDSVPLESIRFSIHIAPDWISLLDLYEATAEMRYLAAAEQAARWFVSLLWVEPPPATDALATTATPPLGTGLYHHNWPDTTWMAEAVAYPRRLADIAAETVPAWLVSRSGMGFEAWCSYEGRQIQNPAWAAHLLRLARYTNEPLYRTLAENSIVGRFTNYPGYYQRQALVAHLRPDFPYLGPASLTSIYYHHILPQLGLTLDYLIEQVRDRSGEQISFPAVRDDSYVHFRHQLCGHAPGRFYHYHDAWLWMPPGLLQPDSHLLNWVAAHSSDGKRLYLALCNSAAYDVATKLQLDLGQLGGNGPLAVEFLADSRHEPLANGTIALSVAAHAMVALVIHGTSISEPLHRVEPLATTGPALLTLVASNPQLGTVRAALVGIGPDYQRLYVFITAGPEQVASAVLEYERDGEQGSAECAAFPFEWSLAHGKGPLRFRVTVIDHGGQRHTSPEGQL